jgi:hypothetical protein
MEQAEIMVHAPRHLGATHAEHAWSTERARPRPTASRGVNQSFFRRLSHLGTPAAAPTRYGDRSVYHESARASAQSASPGHARSPSAKTTFVLRYDLSTSFHDADNSKADSALRGTSVVALDLHSVVALDHQHPHSGRPATVVRRLHYEVDLCSFRLLNHRAPVVMHVTIPT